MHIPRLLQNELLEQELIIDGGPSVEVEVAKEVDVELATDVVTNVVVQLSLTQNTL